LSGLVFSLAITGLPDAGSASAPTVYSIALCPTLRGHWNASLKCAAS